MLLTPSRAVPVVVLGVDSLPVNEDAGLVSAMEAVVGLVFSNGGFFVLFEVPIGLELLLDVESLFPCCELCCLHLARRFLNQTYKRFIKKSRGLAWP